MEEIKFASINIPKIKKENRIPEQNMVDILTTYSGEEFELFILEWLKFCKKRLSEKSLIMRIGGTGDKGVDIYYKDEKSIVYYQAKQYNHQLKKNEVYDIIIKIYWYCFKGENPEPSDIYIVSSKGVDRSAVYAFSEFDLLKRNLLLECKKILNRLKINFDSIEEFKEYLSKKDLSIIKNLDINDVVLDYYNSEYGTIRFHKQEPFRKRVLAKNQNNEEDKFIVQLKNIYKDNPKKLKKILSDAKENYYSSLCLKETDKFLFGNTEEFDLAKEDIYEGVNMLFYNSDNDADNYVKCLQQVIHVPCSNSVLGMSGLNIISNSDKKGICHHLVNDGKIEWENNQNE